MDQASTCPNCGHGVHQSAGTCGYCGAALARPIEDFPSEGNPAATPEGAGPAGGDPAAVVLVPALEKIFEGAEEAAIVLDQAVVDDAEAATAQKTPEATLAASTDAAPPEEMPPAAPPATESVALEASPSADPQPPGEESEILELTEEAPVEPAAPDPCRDIETKAGAAEDASADSGETGEPTGSIGTPGSEEAAVAGAAAAAAESFRDDKAERLKKHRAALAKAEALKKRQLVLARAAALKKKQREQQQKAAAPGAPDSKIVGRLAKYLGKTIGINYDNTADIREAELVEVNHDYLSVVVREQKLRFSFPLRTLLSVVEGREGVTTTSAGTPLNFNAVVKIYPLVLF